MISLQSYPVQGHQGQRNDVQDQKVVCVSVCVFYIDDSLYFFMS